MNFIIGIIIGWVTRSCVNNDNCTSTKLATRPRPKPPSSLLK